MTGWEVVARYGFPFGQRVPDSVKDDLAAYEGEDGHVIEVVRNEGRRVTEFVVLRQTKCDECSLGCSPCALGHDL